MIDRAFFRTGVRYSQRIALVVLAMSAAAVADGSLAPMVPTFSNEVEGALVRSIVGLRESGLKHALGEIEKTLDRHPNFRLGHMVKGDILMARAGRPVAFASASADVASVAPLQDEARVRLRRYLDAPPIDALPAPVLQLAPRQAHVLVVDTSRSRMYVYANHAGRPRYVTDFYISLGKNGTDKTREGDQKTPTGVYTIIASKEKLPDFYGPGAYPVNYPNDWDKMQGRKGHGIWLHGTPSATYSRPPWATDGCLVLTNDDFARLARYVDVNRTPVVIGQDMEWRDPKALEADRAAVMGAFARWRADWESMDTARYLANYSGRFRAEKGDFGSWSAKKRKVNSGKTWIKVAAHDVSVFAYPGAKDTMMITFEQDYRSNNLSNRTVKRQYWVREGGAWRILHEAVVS